MSLFGAQILILGMRLQTRGRDLLVPRDAEKSRLMESQRPPVYYALPSVLNVSLKERTVAVWFETNRVPLLFHHQSNNHHPYAVTCMGCSRHANSIFACNA